MGLSEYLIPVLLTLLLQENVNANKKCVFPFTYKGVVYDACTSEGSKYNEFWCSTLPEYSEATESFIYCDKKCAFPFTYKGAVYNACTSVDSKNGKLWCSTHPKYIEEIESYIYCDAATANITDNVADINVTHIGCYMDNADHRDLNKRWIKLPNKMTIGYCHRRCKYFKFFALQDGDECFCGNRYNTYGRRDGECDVQCDGNANEMCGNVLRNSVYQHAKALTVNEAAYIGCFLVPFKPYRVPVWIKHMNEMTVEKCDQFCKSFPYFGLSSGDRCYCGMDYLLDNVRQDSKCYRPCAGNKDQICGGGVMNSIYIHTMELPITYIGCYMDSESVRDLSARWIRQPVIMSIGYCHELCIYFPFFALQAGDNCFCGKSYNRHGPRNGECNHECSGNKNSICGGILRNSVYEHTARKPLLETTYIGCFKDTSNRDLNGTSTKLKDPNINTCDQFCELFPYFGIQNGHFCFCGTSYGKHGVMPDSDCNMPCKGDDTKICGGEWRNSVYRRDVTNGCKTEYNKKKYQSRIAYGEAVNPGEFPWMVRLITRTSVFNYYGCSGVLIEKKWILTSAHCYPKSDSSFITDTVNARLAIMLGDTNWDVNEDTEQNPIPKQIIMHPGFIKNKANDIALIELESPVNLNKYVHAVCLPAIDENFENLNCTAVGFGKIENDESNNLLKKGILPIINSVLCEELVNLLIRPEFLCAGYDKIPQSPAVRGGDSGGALTCSKTESEQKYRWTLAGITTWSVSLNNKTQRPDVFMRVSSYLTWIEETIRLISKKDYSETEKV